MGLSPHLTVDETVEADGNGPRRVERKVVTDPVEHKRYKAAYLQRWMSRRGLEDEGKWMDDHERSLNGEVLTSPLVQDTRYGRQLRERVLQGHCDAADGVAPAAARVAIEAAAMHPRARLAYAGCGCKPTARERGR